jgi:hypothetical protein
MATSAGTEMPQEVLALTASDRIKNNNFRQVSLCYCSVRLLVTIVAPGIKQQLNNLT